MKKFIAVILLITVFASTCLFSTGCTATDNVPANTDEETIVGTWTGEIDFAPFLFEEDDDDDFTKYLELDSFMMPAILRFNADNTWEMSIDEEAFEKTSEAAVEALTNAMIKYIEDMLKESGTGLTIEDYEKEIGMSIEDYCSDLFEEPFDHDFITDSGEYTFDGTELIFGEGPSYTIDLDGNKLTITGCSDPDDEAFAVLRDTVFKRS